MITSARADRDAYRHPSYLYGYFNYSYLSAPAGHGLLGNAAVDADTNDNAHVSITEAYDYTLPRLGGYGTPPIAAQMPQFEDNGTRPSRYGPLPGAGEGLVGVVTYL